jgi:ribonucleotide monophosphatase NagD (HAD superfamily)
VTRLPHIRGLLLDMDGVIMMSWRPLSGAVEALTRLRAAGLPLRLVS